MFQSSENKVTMYKPRPCQELVAYINDVKTLKLTQACCCWSTPVAIMAACGCGSGSSILISEVIPDTRVYRCLILPGSINHSNRIKNIVRGTGAFGCKYSNDNNRPDDDPALHRPG